MLRKARGPIATAVQPLSMYEIGGPSVWLGQRWGKIFFLGCTRFCSYSRLIRAVNMVTESIYAAQAWCALLKCQYWVGDLRIPGNK